MLFTEETNVSIVMVRLEYWSS